MMLQIGLKTLSRSRPIHFHELPPEPRPLASSDDHGRTSCLEPILQQIPLRRVTEHTAHLGTTLEDRLKHRLVRPFGARHWETEAEICFLRLPEKE